MKKVLLINGSPNEHGCTDVALLKTQGLPGLSTKM